MRWEYGSIENYVQAQEFIDTAIIPLVLIELGDRTVDSARHTNYMVEVASTIEDQLKGRVMQFPLFTIVPQFTDELLAHGLAAYIDQLKQNGFKNVVFLTQNSFLEQRQLDIEGDILRVKDTNAQTSKELQEDIQKEGRQLVQTFIQIWNR